MSKNSDYTVEGLVGGFVSACGGLTVVCAIGIVLYQCGLWLKDGLWTSIAIEDALGRSPPLPWIGVGKIVNWVLSCPLSVGVLVLGFIVIWIGAEIAKLAPSAVATSNVRPDQVDTSLWSRRERDAWNKKHGIGG